MRSVLGFLFSAKAQVAVGVVATLAGALAWAYYAFVTSPNVTAVFHVSMFFGLVACYAIVATGLGYRATERVEEIVVENADVNVDVKP